ncbi:MULTISPECIES: acetyltransferase [unclassified Oceanobacter]|jgi:hypothetical protein|uniref:acetyltransferase n=1 Tax=unclassified Oceanobacter TaxID=2620260 RepID=UPI002701ACFE|nr:MULTISPECIES: acetyltransferase [unclassified Oceanobacter]MDO6804162.1 acetyltransferase [Wenyingzhuangia sp. 1_MG-2023]MDP2504937.1 acetyltransferase [Oceanobacter sp. 3_MG-2023]MDP2546381.1 acetyltransferase [Oceanobacter sp. 4_MG-2023]MDP2610429.1 acetyltransferase [Oceanobacter sp. 1_MG-2023]MDP2613665.1 acetyltransferase [Oceanobacter sp. 2_MG-2023]
MNEKIARYGVKPVQRPKIKADRQLDLSGEEGKKIIQAETRSVLKKHAKTFAKLADM